MRELSATDEPLCEECKNQHNVLTEGILNKGSPGNHSQIDKGEQTGDCECHKNGIEGNIIARDLGQPWAEGQRIVTSKCEQLPRRGRHQGQDSGEPKDDGEDGQSGGSAGCSCGVIEYLHERVSRG